MSEKPPQMAPYARHVLLCTGQFCDSQGKAGRLYEQLPNLLGELGNYDNPQRVKRGTSPCLGVCGGGPILVVYPDGIWYHHVDMARLARIVEQHLIGGEPVQEWVFHQMSGRDHDE
jgi:(2Fe-2S) ferredoxin